MLIVQISEGPERPFCETLSLRTRAVSLRCRRQPAPPGGGRCDPSVKRSRNVRVQSLLDRKGHPHPPPPGRPERSVVSPARCACCVHWCVGVVRMPHERVFRLRCSGLVARVLPVVRCVAGPVCLLCALVRRCSSHAAREREFRLRCSGQLP